MTDNEKIASVLPIVFAFGILFIANCNLSDKIKSMKSQAVEYGYAEYNKTNGDWQWTVNKTNFNTK
jgi:hypothetical protein